MRINELRKRAYTTVGEFQEVDAEVTARKAELWQRQEQEDTSGIAATPIWYRRPTKRVIHWKIGWRGPEARISVRKRS